MSTETAALPPQKVIAYVDGFNLYFGMKDNGLRSCYWLDVQRFAALYLRSNQQLVKLKYFTARIAAPEEKKRRQEAYLDALKTLPDLEIYEGKYKSKNQKCQGCGRITSIPTEKMTDVNIATEMLADAFNNRFDTAFLISGDSDLVPPIRHVTGLSIKKNVLAIFPPNRISDDIREAATAYTHVGRARLRTCQFPDVIVRPGAPSLTRPSRWA